MAIKILYVEDNPFSVHLMQLYLRRHHEYKLMVATDGQSGWEQAIQYEPDLILMDINLPDMSGWDLTRKLRSYPLTATIPIIAITSLTLQRSYELSMQAGVNLHFNKTTHFNKLLQHMDELLNQRQV